MSKSRRFVAIVAASAAALLGAGSLAAGNAGASGTSTAGLQYYKTVRTCAPSTAKHATCFAMKLVRTSAKTPGARPMTARASALTTGPSGGYTPADLATAYSLVASAATTQVVAIVDAYANPTIKADLATFDSQYGLHAETATSFRVLNQLGKASPLPTANAGWAIEEDLDVQAVRGLCNKCKIILIEANSNQNSDLDIAENRAVALGATVVSNSFGGPESGPISAADRNAYNHTGVAIVASTGDDGYFSWDSFNSGGSSADAPNTPSSLNTVIAAGGTSLYLNDDATRASEQVWNENGPQDFAGYNLGAGLGASGGGCSTINNAATWQKAVAGYATLACGVHRSTGDIAADADPYTGYDVYVGGDSQWETYGGTSLSAPLLSAMIALAGGPQGVDYPAQTIYSHYSATPAADSPIYDVTVGANSFCGTASNTSCANYTGGSPNNLGAGQLDCGFAPTGTATLPHNSECHAKVGYDGPTGVGAPKNLGVFQVIPG